MPKGNRTIRFVTSPYGRFLLDALGTAKSSSLRIVTPPLGNRIRAAREYAGISRDELARRIEYKAGGTIGRLERGDWTEYPKERVLRDIANACGVPPWFVISGFDETSEERPER